MGGVFSLLIPSLEKLSEKLQLLTNSSNERKFKLVIPRPELSYEFHKIFNEIKQEVLKDQVNCLVIALDNLDRCDPENVLEILAMIKSFMNVDNCKYIVTCDKDAIENHLKRAFGNSEENKNDAREFLTKFFQIQLYVPPIAWGDLADYADTLLNETGLTQEPIISEIISLGLNQKNPRKVRQHINNALAFYKHAEVRESNNSIPKTAITGNLGFLFKYVILRDEFPEFHRALEMDDSLISTTDSLLSGNLKGYAEKTDYPSELLENSPRLKNFLLNTIGIKTDDISIFLYLNATKSENHLLDDAEFKDLILQLDKDDSVEIKTI